MESLQVNMESILSNPVTYGVVAIFLAMYGPRLQPRLPAPVKDLFNVPLFRFAVIALIIYMSNRDLTMSLIITIAFLVVLSIANSQDMQEEFMDRYREGYSSFDMIKEFYDNHEDDDNQEGPEMYDPNTENYEKGPEPFDADVNSEDDKSKEDSDQQQPELFQNYENFEEKGAMKECGSSGPCDEGQKCVNGACQSATEQFMNFREFYGDDDEDSENPPEHFTPYENHLNNVMNKYKFGN